MTYVRRISAKFAPNDGAGGGGIFRSQSSAATQAAEARARVAGQTHQNPNSADQTANQGTEQNNNQGGDDHTSNHEQFLAELWKPDQDNNSQNQQVSNGQQQQTEQKKPSLREHLDSKGFNSGVDFRDFDEKIRGGNPAEGYELLEAGFKNAMEQTYISVMQDILPEMNTKIEQAINKAVGQATGATNLQGSIEKMHNQLEYTKGELFRPMAEALMQRAMSKGKTIEEAIEIVDYSFQQQAAAYNEKKGPPQQPGSGGYGGNRQTQQQPNMDFDDLFTAT